MAGSVADMLVGSALQSSDNAPNISGAIESGVGLALKVQQVQQQREALEQQKQQQYQAKIEKFSSLYETAAKLPPGAARNGLFKTVIPKTRDALGLQKEFPDDSMVILNANPEVVGYLKAKVEANEMTLPQLLANMQDAQWIADNVPAALQAKAGQDLTPQVTEDMEALQKSENFRINEKNQSENAKEQARAQAKRAEAEDDRKPVVKAKLDLQASHDKFLNQGGQASAEAKLQKIKNAVDYFKAQVDSGKGSTGTVGTAVASRVGLVGLKDPKLKVAIDDARASINLKDSLDSQFSSKEAEQQYGQRGPDPDLPAEENYKRTQAMYQESLQAYKNRVAQFKKGGLDTNGAISEAKKKQFFMIKDPAAREKAINGLVKILGMPIEDVRKELGLE